MRTAQCIAALVTLIATQANADEASDLGRQAVFCWNIPAKYDERAVVVFDVTLDSAGRVTDITVVEYSPPGDAGRDAVMSASLAVERCAPYSVAGAGTRRMRMEIENSAPIDPFKGR